MDAIPPPDPSLVDILSGPDVVPEVNLATCPWFKSTVEIAKDTHVVEWAQSHSVDDIEKAVVPYASRGGAFILDEQAKAHLAGRKCEIDTEIWDAIPRLPIDREDDGVYAIVFGHREQRKDGTVVFVVDGIYVGISLGADNYVRQNRARTEDGLRHAGYSESEIAACLKETLGGGMAARLARSHLAPPYREAYSQKPLYKHFDSFEEVKAVVLFGSNGRTPTATEDEGVYVALREHVGIIGAGFCNNYSYARAAPEIGEALGLDPANILRTNIVEQPLQQQVGLEGRGRKDWRTPYIETSTTLGIEQPRQGSGISEAKTRTRLQIATKETHLFGPGQIWLRPEMVIPPDKPQKVRVQFSFNEAGARAAWDRMHPRRRLGPFGPIVPNDGDHPFLVLFVSAYDKTGIVRTMTVHDASDPTINSAKALDRLYRYVYPKLFEVNQTIARVTADSAILHEGIERDAGDPAAGASTFEGDLLLGQQAPGFAGLFLQQPGAQAIPEEEESGREPTTEEDDPRPPVFTPMKYPLPEEEDSGREPTTEEDEPAPAPSPSIRPEYAHLKRDDDALNGQGL